MTQRIEEIVIPDSVREDYTGVSPFDSLSGIKKLNVLIGPNNSGKSRLLRALFSKNVSLKVSPNGLHDSISTTEAREMLSLAATVSERMNKYPALNGCEDRIRTVVSENSLGFAMLSGHTGSQRESLTDLKPILQELSRHRGRHHDNEQLTRKLQAFVNQRSSGENGGLAEAKFVYIPTLRGLRVLGDKTEGAHYYFDRTWNDYFSSLENSRVGASSTEEARRKFFGSSIVTGLELFETITANLLGSLTQRRFVRRFEEYLSTTFFHSKPVALIPRHGDDTLHVKIGDEKERSVTELGDGIQQLIILTFPLFQYSEEPLFLFIEEPDLFLHPGFQRVFIEAVTKSPNPDLYTFVTTHSNQFLELTLETDAIAVFRCSKEAGAAESEEHEPKFTVVNSLCGDTEILKHIGVLPSSMMLANCTIWVEGITDRLYYGRFLKLYFGSQGLSYHENLHYAFMEYGGGNITHWSFLDEDEGMNVDRLCARLFLISDRDKNKDDRHQALEKSLGERFCRLDVVETENLLTPPVISKVILDYEGKEFQVPAFEQTAYANQLLGRYIDSTVLLDKTASKRYRATGKKTAYEDSSGTIKGKVDFCRKALSHIDSFDELSDEAKAVTKRLGEFVRNENK